MRYINTFLLFFALLIGVTTTVNAQIDNRKGSFAIPAVKSKIENQKNVELPKEVVKPLNPKKNPPNIAESPYDKPKTFSLFNEEFGNNGNLFKKQIDKNIANTKLSPKEVEQLNGSKTDQFFGDFRTQAKSVNILYRDFGAVDGDLIQIRVNDDVIADRVFLNGGFSGLNLELKQGVNKIDFVALNQGQSGPNTAEFKAVDDQGVLITQNCWNLATGVKATIVIVKE